MTWPGLEEEVADCWGSTEFKIGLFPGGTTVVGEPLGGGGAGAAECGRQRNNLITAPVNRYHEGTRACECRRGTCASRARAPRAGLAPHPH